MKKTEDKLFIEINGKKIYSLDEISHEQVLKEMPYTELIKRRMNDSKCGKQSQLIGSMVRDLFEMTDKYTKEELNLVDEIRVELKDKFNKEWNKTTDYLKEVIDKRLYVEWKKEKNNENG